ncbi:HNH endonuclease [Brevifollis gellanilyticus]|uniref:Restriction endonuclease n=1 Tax=Brevifollis gellanilyticus TaxID=748831 RepID=A0A512MFA3_9BACT|nr:HNH endonuclease [Brevifollis gellanilyticus]GEP45021.1 restriction endonuclease [Brevifollis gellanilyticus]
MTPRAKWTRDDLLVALNLYHKLAFGQMHARQPVIVEVAKKMGRSANSLAMKLCNFASLDPALKIRGIKGLRGASAKDKDVWQEFSSDMANMAPASEQALRKLYHVADEFEIDVIPKVGIIVRKDRTILETDKLVTVKTRRGQDFFREAVLNNFDGRCGISQLAIRELLIASHILPWASHPAERLNVRNGLCLSRIHDAAFDQGLIAFDDSLNLILSKRLRAQLPHPMIVETFERHEGKPIILPEEATVPDTSFFAIHRKSIFKDAA